MNDFCSCEDWKDIKGRHATVFTWRAPYGWIIAWKELTEEKGYTQVHNYGISITHCPMCGKKLEPAE